MSLKLCVSRAEIDREFNLDQRELGPPALRVILRIGWTPQNAEGFVGPALQVPGVP